MEEQNFEGGLTVKPVDQETPTPQEAEAQVLEQAADSGEITPEAAGIEKAEDGTFKIDLDKLNVEQDAIQERETEEVSVGERTADSEKVDEEVREQPSQEDESPLELVKEEVSEVQDGDAPQAQEEILEEQEEQPKVELPENVDKLVQFMEETGGSLEDYVNLNRDISKMDPVATIREFYKQTKPYLTDDQIQRQLNKKFYYGEEAESDEIEDKKIAFQEELFKAQKHITDSKDKYYADLKLSKQSQLAPEVKEAVEYYQTNKQQKQEFEKMNKTFIKRTNDLFNDEFKGFDFSVGENKYKFKVNDVPKVKEFQSDINNFVGQFLGDDGTVKDAKGYHRAMFAAQNADKLAQHFYEQGRADAIRNTAKEANNINMDPRKDASSITTPSGDSVKVVSGDSMDKLRIRWNK